MAVTMSGGQEPSEINAENGKSLVDQPIWHRTDVVRHYRERFFRIFPVEKYLFTKYIEKHMKVLDLACGGGRVSRYLKPRTAFIKGVDISEEMVEAYRRNVEQAVVECRSISELDEPREFYDAILVPYNSLDYVIPYSERRKAIRKMRASLKSGGLLIFSGHNTFGTIGVFLFYPRPQNFINEAARLIRGECFRDKTLSKSVLWGEQPIHFRMRPSYVVRELCGEGFEFVEMRGGKLCRRQMWINTMIEPWVYYVFRKKREV